MKLISFSLVIIVLQNAVNAQLPIGKTCPYVCNRIPIQDYKSGMRFYFPDNKALSENNKLYPEMLLKDPCDADTNLKIPTYQNLAGKTFKIASDPTSRLLKNYPGDNHYKVRFELKGLHCNAELTYEIVVDRRKITATGNDESEEDTYTIEGAIVVDEVEYARNNLVGNTYYLISKDTLRHNQEVTISHVEPGTYETPLLIYYEDKNKNVDSVFVGICNTNVEVPFLKNFHFTKFFSCESKPLPVIEPGITTIKDVISILGKPKKITTTETDSLKTVEYVYEGRILTFENDKLKKIVKTE